MCHVPISARGRFQRHFHVPYVKHRIGWIFFLSRVLMLTVFGPMPLCSTVNASKIATNASPRAIGGSAPQWKKTVTTSYLADTSSLSWKSARPSNSKMRTAHKLNGSINRIDINTRSAWLNVSIRRSYVSFMVLAVTSLSLRKSLLCSSNSVRCNVPPPPM
jgi:hypothetical protein